MAVFHKIAAAKKATSDLMTNFAVSILSVILPNHTQTSYPAVMNLVWDSQYCMASILYGIASGRISGRVLCSKNLASNLC